MARVTLFGAFSDRAGWRDAEIEAATLGELRNRLSARDPWLGEQIALASTLIILEGAIQPSRHIGDDRPLPQDAEVGFGPPVSGG